MGELEQLERGRGAVLLLGSSAPTPMPAPQTPRAGLVTSFRQRRPGVAGICTAPSRSVASVKAAVVAVITSSRPECESDSTRPLHWDQSPAKIVEHNCRR